MGIAYRIYKNNGYGGPVDLSTPVGDTALLTFDTSPLLTGSDYTWAVYPYDTVTGYEDRTADSRVRFLLDDQGDDATSLPLAPQFLAALAGSGGTAKVTWYYPLGMPVSGFHVYAWRSSDPPNWTTPAGAVGGALPRDGTSHARAYRFLLTGLADGVAYSVGVRGFNSFGEAINSGTASVTGRSSGPAPIPSLTATQTA